MYQKFQIHMAQISPYKDNLHIHNFHAGYMYVCHYPTTYELYVTKYEVDQKEIAYLD